MKFKGENRQIIDFKSNTNQIVLSLYNDNNNNNNDAMYSNIIAYEQRYDVN